MSDFCHITFTVSMKVLRLTLSFISVLLVACNSNSTTETKTTDTLQQLVNKIRDSIARYPDEPRLRYNLAIVYKNAEQYQQALAVLDSLPISRSDSSDPFLYFNTMFQKADIYEQLSDTIKAIQTYEEFVQPGELTIAGFNLARLYAETKNPKTLSIVDSMLRYDELSAPEPDYFRGIYYFNTGDFAKAAAAFDESIKKDYTFLDAHLEKGISYYKMKKYAEAISAFDIALQVSNTFADAYYWKGRAQEALGDRIEAKKNYERAFGLDKTFIDAKNAADTL